jgi:hypothetical protein
MLASRSPADTAYQEALQRYEENLNSRELESVKRPTSLEDVLGEVEKLIRKHEGSKVVKFCDKLGQVREKLNPLDALLQGACKSVPFRGGEPIWGAVQFVFNLVEDSQSAFEAVFDFFRDWTPGAYHSNLDGYLLRFADGGERRSETLRRFDRVLVSCC